MRKTILAAVVLTTLTLSLTACSSDTKKTTQAPTTTVGQTTEKVTEAATTEAPTEAVTTEAPTEAATTEKGTEKATTEAVTEEKKETAEDNGSEADKQAQGEGAAAAFDAIWKLFKDDEKFPSIGGDMENSVDGAPGTFSLMEKEALTGNYYIPEECLEKIDDVATLMHMMNANTFTGAVVHVTKADDTAAVAESIKTNIEGTQWMCGFPDRLIVAQISENNIAYAFGKNFNMTNYADKLTEAYPDAKLLFDVDLMAEN